MTPSMLSSLSRLMRTVAEFESAVGATVVVHLKTTGETKLVVTDDASGMKQTIGFRTPQQATEHLRETAL